MIPSIYGFDSEVMEMSAKIPITVLPVVTSGLTGFDVRKFLFDKVSQGSPIYKSR